MFPVGAVKYGSRTQQGETAAYAATGFGAKITLRLALCPAARVSGRPLRLNPDPVIAACETVRFDPPELPRTSD
jgi:hypothetical protein